MKNLTWRQIEVNAAAFAEEWKNAKYEKGETQSFYNDFFEIFGVKRRSVARFEEHVRKLDNSSGFIDLFWPGVLIVEQKSLGKDLGEAANQAGTYFDALEEHEKPRYQLLCDFRVWKLYDRDENVEISFELADLASHIQNFAFILGKQYGPKRVKEPVNLGAAELVSELYSGLKASNYPDHDLEQLIVRIVFCLFADDTSIFQPRGLFADLIDARTASDGSDVGSVLSLLFQVLNTVENARQGNLDPDFSIFPHVNGELFKDTITIPSFDSPLREQLLRMTNFDWSGISPAIFGELFQLVLSKQERERYQLHSTSEENILKVISDLFLNELRIEFDSIRSVRHNKASNLLAFRKKLTEIRVLDPACGCGNFLVVAYREIRRIENEILKELNNLGKLEEYAPELARVDVDQFFGIEPREYSAKIAESALWMADHVSNNELSLEIGQDFYRIPLDKSPKILIEDSLKADWEKLISPHECSFILGNPPYKGSKKQTPSERRLISSLAHGQDARGTLDYVSGWILKAAEFSSPHTRISFVTTSSIVQGEQVANLWPLVLKRFNREIFFAHQTFIWKTDSVNRANVDVVIFGLCDRKAGVATKRLYSYEKPDGAPSVMNVEAISPYLIDGSELDNPDTVVYSSRVPINGMKKLVIGSKPIDGGYYILSEEEKGAAVSQDPKVGKYIHPYVGSDEFLYGKKRYILYLDCASPSEIANSSFLKSAVQSVRNWRSGKIPNKKGSKKRESPDELAKTPLKFHVTRVPEAPYLIIPEVTSERRDYIPIGWLEPPTIPSNLVKILTGASLVDFALLSSAMHMAWTKGIGGKLQSRNRYSIYLLYNNFPIPEKSRLSGLDSLARRVLQERANYPEENLHTLYDPSFMPSSLAMAHKALDMAVDRAYFDKAISDDHERLVILLNLYEARRLQA